MANEEQLRKLAQIFNTERIVSQEEIAGVLEAIVGILANNKKSIDALTEESKNTLSQTLQNIADEHNSIVSQVDKVTRETKSSVESEVKSQLEAVQKRVEDLIAECKDMMPEDGKDADEAQIVADVLEKIKLPEYKEVVLDDGGEIVDKINALNVSPDNQIDASHIKNLPQAGTGGGSGLRTVFHDSTMTGTGTSVDPLKVVGGGGGTVGPGTANEIAYFDSTTTVASLTTSTYPSLTELSYVKGVTSAIQTQLNAKGTFTLPSLTAGSVLFSNGTTIAQNNTAFNWNDTNTALALTGSSNNTTLNITNTSVTSQAVFSVTGPASTDVNTGKGFTVFTTGEAFARAMFYTDGKFGIGPGSSGRDVYLSRSAANVFRVSSDAATGAADLEVTRHFLPVTSDGGALGSTSKMWSDLFLASGAVINFNNGNLTLTHAAGVLTLQTATTPGFIISSSSTSSTAFQLNNSTTNAHNFQFFTTGSANTPGYFGVYSATADKVVFSANGTSGNTRLISGAQFGFSSDANYSYQGTLDIALARAASGILKITDGSTGSGKLRTLILDAGTATASTAPLKFTSGTLLTTAEAGAIEYDGTNFYLSPSTTRKRIPLTNNATPTNGQIPIGNGTDYTVAAITAGSGISVTNGAGSITIAASAASPVVSYDYVIQRSGANTVAIKMSDQSTLSTNADAAVVFQAAVDAIDASTATGGSIFVKAGTYSFASVVTIAGDNTIDSKAVAIHGDGVQTTIISPASGTNGLSITNQAKVSLKDFAIYVKGTSNGIVSSNSSNGLRAFWQSEFRNIYIYGDDGTHTGWGMDLGNPFRSVFENIEINQVKNGIRMTATDTTTGYNPGDLTFNRSFIELRNVAGGVGLEIASPNTGSMNQMIFNMVEFYAGGTGQTAILLSGSAGNNHNNFNGINAEQFDTILDIEYGRNNYLDFNYIVTRDAVSTTYFKTTVDSYNNRVSCKYLDTPTRAVTIVNDANTSTLQPNVFTDIILQGTATTTTFTTTAATIVTGVRDNVLGTSRYIDPTALKAVDPGADRIPFWDDSTDMMGLLTASTGLTISGTSMTTDVSLANTATLTNKRITKRVGTTTSSATPTINTDNVDMYTLTAQTVDITSFTTNLSGTPTDGQTLWIAITGTGARAITWGASFEASTVALPTTTVSTNRLDVGFVWNAATSKWRCVASC